MLSLSCLAAAAGVISFTIDASDTLSVKEYGTKQIVFTQTVLK
jgi:hypothetical protein